MTTLVALGTGVAYGYSTFVTLWRQLGGEFVAKWQAANASGTVVRRDVAPGSVVGGVPARVIGKA